MPRPERVPRVLDMRLTVPALVAWAVTAATLGWPVTGRFVVAGATGVGAALLGWAFTRVSSRPAARPVLTVVALSLAVTSLTAVASAGHEAVRRAGPVADLARLRAIVHVGGVALTDARTVGTPGRGEPMAAVRLRIDRVTARGETHHVSTPVLVIGDESWAGVRWHDRVRAVGRLGPAPTGGDVVAEMDPLQDPRVVGEPGVVRGVAEHMRSGLRSAVDDLSPDARGLLPGLVIGDTSLTPPDLTDAMRATGMTHLSAVSGSNVAIILAVALGACGFVGVRRQWRPWVALAVLGWFVILARPDPSVIRAATMGAIGLVGMTRSRRGAGLPVLAAAVVLLLVVDPWLARSYGFALSTLATLGLLVFVRPWGEAIGRRLPRRIAGWGPALAIPVAAQVMCAPVIVLLQGSVSLIGVLANLVVAPLVAPATVLGVAAAATALASPRVASWLAWLGGVPTLGIARVARVGADVPGGTVPWPDGGVGALSLAALTVVALVTARFLVHVGQRHLLVVFTAAVLAVAALTPTSVATWPPAGWWMVVCDVGQGDAIVLRSGPGRAVLVDTGPDPEPVDGCLSRLGVRVIDAVVLTHFHADHVDGLPGALAGRTVREILTTPVGEPQDRAADVHAEAMRHGIPLATLVAGDGLRIGTVHAAVWWPARRIDAGSVPNNASVVLDVRDGPVRALLLGDVEREAAHAILLRLRRDREMAADARSFDVVKTPHHGSANLDEGFMAAVAAPIGVISVGRDNDYGHPTPTQLRVLRQDGYAVHRTDEDGDVAIASTSRGIVVRARG